MVIGSGPHHVQPIEYVGAMPVLYSVGNFVFGTPGPVADPRSARPGSDLEPGAGWAAAACVGALPGDRQPGCGLPAAPVHAGGGAGFPPYPPCRSDGPGRHGHPAVRRLLLQAANDGSTGGPPMSGERVGPALLGIVAVIAGGLVGVDVVAAEPPPIPVVSRPVAGRGGRPGHCADRRQHDATRSDAGAGGRAGSGLRLGLRPPCNPGWRTRTSYSPWPRPRSPTAPAPAPPQANLVRTSAPQAAEALSSGRRGRAPAVDRSVLRRRPRRPDRHP